MSDLQSIREKLARYRHFSECIVEDVRWLDYGTTVTITVDYIWHSDGALRGDADERLFVDLSFRMVQELEVNNQLGSAVLADPDVIDWSHAEIACLSLALDDRSTGLPRRVFEARFEREHSTWIRVVFSEIEVIEVPKNPASSVA